MHDKKHILSLLLLTVFTACQWLVPGTDPGEAVARVGDTYLYKSELDAQVSEAASPQDSTQLAQVYIRQWATRQLLLQQAKINLSDEKQAEYETLVDSYRSDLYTKAYKDLVAANRLDSTIPTAMLDSFYTANRANYRLNEELLQLRYLHLAADNGNLGAIKNDFRKYDSTAQAALQQHSLQFKNHSLDDSTWVKASTVLRVIPAVNTQNVEQLLKKRNFVELQDSLDVYLIYVNDVLFRNEEAPLPYVKPHIEQILLNNRKLELVKQLEKDILQDAIRNKTFEEFEN